LSASRIATSAHSGFEAFAQQVDADQRIERAEAQIPMISMRSMVSMSSACSAREYLLMQVFGEVFRHPFCQHGDEAAVTACAVARTSPTRSSTCVRAGRMFTGGSISRSADHLLTNTPRSRSVPIRSACDTATDCGRSCPTLQSAAGLSMQEGSRKPYSAKVVLAPKSPLNMPPIWAR